MKPGKTISARPPPPPPPPPTVVNFMIVGAQKCGTTALAYFLSQHPEICMPSKKEIHLFDKEYTSNWTSEQIDKHYRRFFEHYDGELLRGEATPIYMFIPEIAPELKRYNSHLKLIVLLRDPVERAISHYYMVKRRWLERNIIIRPLWLLLLIGLLWLRHFRDPRKPAELRCRYSFRDRGLYSIQLLNLYRFFNRDQILIIYTEDLRQQHDTVLRQVFAFLERSPRISRSRPSWYAQATIAGGRNIGSFPGCSGSLIWRSSGGYVGYYPLNMVNKCSRAKK